MNTEIYAEKKPGRARRFVHFPLVRIIIGLVFVFGAVILGQIIVRTVVRTFITSDKLPLPWVIVMFLLTTVLAILFISVQLQFRFQPLKYDRNSPCHGASVTLSS